MGAVSRAVGRVLGLPPPAVRHVRVRRGITVRTRDGIPLATDHFAQTWRLRRPC